MEFSTPYERKTREGVDLSAGGRTKQSFKAECDINTILRKYENTGIIEHVSKHQGDYGDYLGAEDYQTSMNRLISAQNAFDELPSKIRKRFDNDPAEFLNFVSNPENKDEMVKLGLAKKPEPTVELANPSTSKSFDIDKSPDVVTDGA